MEFKYLLKSYYTDVLKTSIFWISLNIRTFCCNLKIRALGSKLCGFPIILILKGIMTF